MSNGLFPIRLKALLPICAVSLAVSALADPWSFVVTGDGRTDPKHSPDPTGVNSRAITNLFRAVTAMQPAPKCMFFTGDLVLGTNVSVPMPIAQQFQAWQNTVKSEAPNLALLPMRGNHETYGDPDGATWKAMFNPMLAANNVTYLSGEEGFSFYYSPPGHPEALMIALDQFMPGNIHRVNLDALESALNKAKTDNVKHIFVFAHEMAFTCTSHGDSDNMAAYPEERDKFVNLLQKYGCQYFFAGHDHAYDWMAIQHPDWPTNYVLNQIVCGTAGAPFYPDKGYYGDHHGFDLKRLDHRGNTLGYLVVTVDDDNKDKPVTVTFVPFSLK